MGVVFVVVLAMWVMVMKLMMTMMKLIFINYRTGQIMV